MFVERRGEVNLGFLILSSSELEFSQTQMHPMEMW